ncbi:MAG: hypothetical protein ACTSQY_07660 [Candidatus Odinarchaeia archaeon]
MVVKKSLEEIILTLTEKNIDKKLIYEFLIELGFDEERIAKEMIKLSLINDPHDIDLPEVSNVKKSFNTEKNSENNFNLLSKLTKIERLLEKNQLLLSEINLIIKKYFNNQIVP